MVRDIYPDVPAVYIDTGLEWPEVKEFVHTFDNVTVVRPEMSFREVLTKYGYPVVSKEVSQYIREARTTKSLKLLNKRLHGDGSSGKIPNKWQYLISAPFPISEQCCNVMKKKPAKLYEKQTGRKPYIGVLASDSNQRKQQYLRSGCNAFDIARPTSKPLSIWTEADIWEYLKSRELPYASIYDKGWDRTGCVYCAYGIQYEAAPNRYQRMAETHKPLFTYCIKNLGFEEVLKELAVAYEPNKTLLDGSV